jgi:DNA-binding transcriptional regulator YiaG
MDRQLSQPQVARQLNVHPNTIGKWERGVTRPPPEYAALITRFLEDGE